jgi:hypothetical protein
VNPTTVTVGVRLTNSYWYNKFLIINVRRARVSVAKLTTKIAISRFEQTETSSLMSSGKGGSQTAVASMVTIRNKELPETNEAIQAQICRNLRIRTPGFDFHPSKAPSLASRPTQITNLASQPKDHECHQHENHFGEPARGSDKRNGNPLTC